MKMENIKNIFKNAKLNYKINIRTILLIGIIMEVLGVLIESQNNPNWKDKITIIYFIYTLLQNIAITLIASVLISWITEKYNNNKQNEIAYEIFSVLKNCSDYGLTQISDHFQTESDQIRNEIINSKELYIVMNDGKSFISGHVELLRQRLEKENKKTFIIIQNYEDKEIMNALAKKKSRYFRILS